MSTNTQTEVTIKPDYGDGVYVIANEDGSFSCLGFDVCLNRIERYSIELGLDEPPQVARGTLSAYNVMRGVMEALRMRYEETGERAVSDLSPQLAGLEGWRVEVQDTEWDEPRRFIVGKSTGWLPCHLELSQRNSSGGVPARREYHRVRQIERIR
jgi:hypothetical protein